MSDLAGCFSHNTDHWRTPTEIYNFFISEGYIDPCPFPSCLIILEQGRTMKEYDSITNVKELSERGC